MSNGISVNLGPDKEKKIRDALKKKGLEARKAFIEANPDYDDNRKPDVDDLQIIKSVGNDAKELAKIRASFVAAGRSTFTLDRETIKTEADIAEDDKFKIIPYLFVVQSRSGKVMYQVPKAVKDADKLNSFVDINGNDHQVLRAKRIMVLASEKEIADFAEKVEVTLDLYLQLS